jgi:hypothetical protein
LTAFESSFGIPGAHPNLLGRRHNISYLRRIDGKAAARTWFCGANSSLANNIGIRYHRYLYKACNSPNPHAVPRMRRSYSAGLSFLLELVSALSSTSEYDWGAANHVEPKNPV